MKKCLFGLFVLVISVIFLTTFSLSPAWADDKDKKKEAPAPAVKAAPPPRAAPPQQQVRPPQQQQQMRQPQQQQQMRTPQQQVRPSQPGVPPQRGQTNVPGGQPGIQRGQQTGHDSPGRQTNIPSQPQGQDIRRGQQPGQMGNVPHDTGSQRGVNRPTSPSGPRTGSLGPPTETPGGIQRGKEIQRPVQPEQGRDMHRPGSSGEQPGRGIGRTQAGESQGKDIKGTSRGAGGERGKSYASVDQRKLHERMSHTPTHEEARLAEENYRAERARFAHRGGRESFQHDRDIIRHRFGHERVTRERYYYQRYAFYAEYGWIPPGYLFGLWPVYAVWDAAFLAFALENVAQPQYAEMFYNHEEELAQWRQDMDRLAMQNADLQAQLDQLDRQMAMMQGQRHTNYLPPGTGDIAFAPEVVINNY